MFQAWRFNVFIHLPKLGTAMSWKSALFVHTTRFAPNMTVIVNVLC